MTQQPPATDTGPRVTRDQVREIRTLRRPRDNRMVAGVCEGLSRHLDVDPILIRVAFASLTIFGGTGIILYVIAWLTLPSDDELDSPLSGWLRQPPERVIIGGVAVAATTGLVVLLTSIGFSSPNPVPAILLGLVVLTLLFLLVRRPQDAAAAPPSVGPAEASTDDSGEDSDDGSGEGSSASLSGQAVASPTPPTRPWWRRPDASPPLPAAELPGPAGPTGPGEPPDSWEPTRPLPPIRPTRDASRLLSATCAAVAVTLGGIWFLDVLTLDVDASVYSGATLTMIATALLVGTWYGRSRTLIALGLVAAAVTMVTSVVERAEFGDSSYRPPTAARTEAEYTQGVGRLAVHLEDVADPAALDGRRLEISSSVGQVDLFVPSTFDATIDIEVGLGEITGPSGREAGGGSNQSATVTPVDDGDPDVLIDLNLSFGQVQVFRVDCPGDDPRDSSTGIDQTDGFNAFFEGDPRVPSACA